jgi:hypothetical protein
VIKQYGLGKGVCYTFNIMNYKKLFTILIYVFVLFEIGNIIVLLDMLNVFEVERVINRGIEELIPIVQTILFITGEILAVVILLKTDSEALYIKKTKILSSLFIIISPIIVIIPFVFSYVMQISPIATENMGTSSTSSTSLFYILMTITLLIAVFMIYFISLYRFNILWSKSKKMLFAIFSSIVNIILTAVVLIMSSFGMLDHSLS